MVYCIQAIAIALLWTGAVCLYRYNRRVYPRRVEELRELERRVPREKYHLQVDIWPGDVQSPATTTVYPVIDASASEEERRLILRYVHLQTEVEYLAVYGSFVLFFVAAFLSFMIVVLPHMIR